MVGDEAFERMAGQRLARLGFDGVARNGRIFPDPRCAVGAFGGFQPTALERPAERLGAGVAARYAGGRDDRRTLGAV